MCCTEASRRDFFRIMPAAMAAPAGRSWAAEEEAARSGEELRTLASGAGFGMEILPVIEVKNAEAASPSREGAADVMVIYPAADSGALLRALFPKERDAIVLVRHRPGPGHYWRAALSVRRLKSAERLRLPGDDAVVDDAEELRWRLRALWAVKNRRGTRIVALGGCEASMWPVHRRSRGSGSGSTLSRRVMKFSKSASKARDSHWVMAYGNWLRGAVYAARRFGLTFAMISES